MSNVKSLHDFESVDWEVQVHQSNCFHHIYIETNVDMDLAVYRRVVVKMPHEIASTNKSKPRKFYEIAFLFQNGTNFLFQKGIIYHNFTIVHLSIDLLLFSFNKHFFF